MEYLKLGELVSVLAPDTLTLLLVVSQLNL